MDKNKTDAAFVTRARKSVDPDRKAWIFIHDICHALPDILNRTAFEDGKSKWTYGLMFREWERYASVFSALGMTGSSGTRAGILGSTSASVLFSVYGLNMTGAGVSLVPAYGALTPKRIIRTIISEKLTDFIITDDFAQANLINELLVRKKELGLNNIIVLHVPVSGVTVNPMLTAVQEQKYSYLKSLYGPVCMDELLASYGNHPVSYAPAESSDTAFILHTSGTTGGAGRPVVLSDKALNAAAAGFFGMSRLELPTDGLVTAAIVDLSNAYSMIDQVHVPLAMGAAVALVPGGILNPLFYKAIPHYGINFLFTVSAMFERWMKMPGMIKPDFSGLRYVILGGAAVSAADKRRFYEFMQQNGAGDVCLLNGYGISELGGACFLSTADLDDEAIGYPLPGVSVRLYDEEGGSFLSEKDAPCEGVLYLSSPSLAATELDGKEILKTEATGGTPYVCTNDLAAMDKDGKLTFLGRANRYFINEEGRKYESGRVEAEFSRQPGIESCCVVPVYVKTTHDNIPMLCVSVSGGEDSPEETVLRSLRQIFISEKTLDQSSIPYRVMIAEELPRNSNGKTDLYRITRGEVEGDTYTVETQRASGGIRDFRLVPYEEGPADMIKEVLDGISAELKEGLPFNKSRKNNSNNNNNEEDQEMKKAKKAFEDFNAMNRMGMQWISNMVSRLNQNGKLPGFGKDPLRSMQDMQNKMKEMQKKMQDMQPDMQKMSESVIPAMQQQMEQTINVMNKMNQNALDMMQKMFDQNCRMMEQLVEAAQKMADAAGAKSAKDGDAAEAESGKGEGASEEGTVKKEEAAEAKAEAVPEKKPAKAAAKKAEAPKEEKKPKESKGKKADEEK